MFDLPQTTVFDRRIPKQKFYEHLSVTPDLRRCFVEQINQIIWRNKLAPSTINVAPGKAVTELEVFEIRLNGAALDEGVLRLIDREIPYHILFVLTNGGRAQAWLGYKEAAATTNTFKVSKYFHTEWTPVKNLSLTLSGLDMDAIYESYLRQIAGDALGKKEEPLRAAIDREARRKKLQKQIEALEKKIRQEKQFNRQVELNGELKRLEDIYNES